MSLPLVLALVSQAPARPAQPLRAGQLPPLPLTQLDERSLAADLDNRTFTLTFAQPVPIKDLLLLLVRGTSLSVIPDPSITGSFIGELKNVTVRQALGLILEPLGLTFTVDGAFIRVFRRAPETRIFNLNYVATVRTGEVSVGDTQEAPPKDSYARIGSTTKTDVFDELAKGVQTLLSERATFNVDRKAGLLQVTDFPERLDRVAVYLDAVEDRVQRQVELDVRVVAVELEDENATTIDWTTLGRARDVEQVMMALSAQGKVTVLASPRITVLNNEPAIVKSDALTLSVTPQIAGDGFVTLSLSPIVTTPVVSQADTLARVPGGQTVVVGGFGIDRETRVRRNVGIRGGWFGRGTVVTKKRVEVVVLLTPRIL